MSRLKRTVFHEPVCGEDESGASLTIFYELVCGVTESGASGTNLSRARKFVARLKAARLKRTIFHHHVRGAIKSGATKTNYNPRVYVWHFYASERPTVACTGN
jgi:hypothetical protein